MPRRLDRPNEMATTQKKNPQICVGQPQNEAARVGWHPLTIFKDSVYNIVRKHWYMKKLFSKWVPPHVLMVI